MITLILSALAVWRISHLLSYEEGPFNIIGRMRAFFDETWVADLMDCPQCNSMWIAIPFTFALHGSVATWLALSALSIFIGALYERLLWPRLGL